MERLGFRIWGKPFGKLAVATTQDGKRYLPGDVRRYYVSIRRAIAETGWTGPQFRAAEVWINAYSMRPKMKPHRYPMEWKRGAKVLCTRTPDADNVCKVILDGCTRAEVWKDDRVVVSLNCVTWYTPKPDDDPFVDVIITELGDAT